MEQDIIYKYINGKIITVDKKDSIAESMSVYKDKILTVGKKDDIQTELKEFLKNLTDIEKSKINIEKIDLNGACIVPGFIDAHMHPILSIYYKTQLQLSKVKSFLELEQVFKEEDKIRESDEWIIGFALMENTFTDPNERTFPDRYKLDELCHNRPVIIFRYDGHICSVNSIALERMGIDSISIKGIELDSGEIQINQNGEPTGVFTEGATDFAIKNAPIPSQERFQAASKLFSEELASFGITTCGIIIQAGELGIAGKMGRLELSFMKYLLKEGQIDQDLVFYIVTDKPKKLIQIKRSFTKLFGETDKISIKGLKIWADGSFGAFTAYMFEPFSDSKERKSGFMVTGKERLTQIFKTAYQLGFDLACHAIGDRANRTVVDIYSEIINDLEISEELKKSVRCRIEHASLINEETIIDAAKSDIIIVSQPLFIKSEYKWLEKRLGPKRIKYVYPYRSIIDNGVLLAGASDAPIESPNVLKAIQISVTRNGFIPEQSIKVYEALKMFTFNAAFALGQEDIKGSLEKGKLADFVVLEQDITTVPSGEIANIKILGTYHRGNKIYSSD